MIKSWVMPPASTLRAKADRRLICPTGKSLSPLIFCPASFAKIFHFPRRANHLYTLAPSRPTQGRLAIVTDAGRDAVDAGALSDERRGRGRRSRVVLTPRRWRQVLRKPPQGDGDKKARSPGRARSRPLKPLCAGMPGDSGCDRGD
jgi:hypothetical protein